MFHKASGNINEFASIEIALADASIIINKRLSGKAREECARVWCGLDR